METNGSNKQFGERTADSVQIGFRVPRQLRDRIREQGRQRGTAMTTEFERLVSDGLRFQEMVGDRSRVLIELFGAFLGAPAGNDSMAIAAMLNVMERHFDWHALLNAMMNLEREHNAARASLETESVKP